MIKTTAQNLREIISNKITETIFIRRTSIKAPYEPEEQSQIIEDEIDNFLISNPFFEIDFIEQMLDPGLLGFHSKTVEVSDEWLMEFDENIDKWRTSDLWLSGDDLFAEDIFPTVTELWIPNKEIPVPNWIDSSPSYILLAKELIANGMPLSLLNWRDFERLIGDLLEKEGWEVTVTQSTKDGGIDVIAIKYDAIVGKIKSIWQAKKYSDKNLVRLNHVRELYAIREEQKASKALIVTTSRLTNDAIRWIKKDEFRFGYKEGKDIEDWINKVF